MLVRFSEPMPDYWKDAQEMVRTGRISQHFEPSGYAALIAVGMELGRNHAEFGVEVEQAILHILTVVLVWALMRRLGATALGALSGGVIVALHPELLLSVTKVWDVGLSTLTLVLVVYLALRLLSDGISWSILSLLSIALGFACFDRTNYLLMFLPLAYVLWQIRNKNAMSAKSFAVRGMTLWLLAGVVYCLLSVAVYRSLVFPSNGPYNLYAGQNALSERALLDHLNAEFSLVPSLRLNGMEDAAQNAHDPEWQSYYRAASIEFARAHPVEEIRLTGVKLYTFLPADTKLRGVSSAQGAIKLLLAIPIPFWLGAVIWYRSSGVADWSEADTFICMVAAAYAIPFLITNSDPRFRTPLDVVLIAHSVALLTRTREAERAS
jgi:hypothetical protein